MAAAVEERPLDNLAAIEQVPVDGAEREAWFQLGDGQQSRWRDRLTL